MLLDVGKIAAWFDGRGKTRSNASSGAPANVSFEIRTRP
jgi:hypothetical protein